MNRRKILLVGAIFEDAFDKKSKNILGNFGTSNRFMNFRVIKMTRNSKIWFFDLIKRGMLTNEIGVRRKV